MMIRAIFTGLRVALVCLWGSCMSAQLPYGKVGSEYILAAAALLSLVSLGPAIAAETSGARVEPQMTLSNPAQALARALEYTGFDKAEGYSKASVAEVKLLEGRETKTPFVSGLMNGQQVWSVRFQNISVDSGQHAVKREFQVSLDPITGQLLQVVSICDDVGSSDTLPEPEAAVAESLLAAGNMKINGLPANVPPVSFYQALQSTWYTNPARSKVVKGLYLDYTIQDERYPQR